MTFSVQLEVALQESSGWQVLGTSDEVETCQQCGKHPIKRCVVLYNGFEERYVGTECATRMTGKRAEYIKRKAASMDRENARDSRRAQWDKITNSRFYNQFKLHYGAGDTRKVDASLKRLARDIGLSEKELRGMLSKWRNYKVSE